MYLWPWLKMSIFFTEISCFWRRNERGGAKCRQKKYPKNFPKIGEKSEKYQFIFRFISPIFWKNRRPPPLLIRRLLAFPRWSDGPNLVRAPTVNFMCIWWSKLKLDVIQRPKLNPNGYVMIKWSDFAQILIQRPILFSNGKWDSNSYFGPTFFFFHK